MSKEQDNTLPTGLWIPEHRVPDYEARGYHVTDPQPNVSDDQKRYHRGSVHMTKGSHDGR